jgi:bacteriocin-like protein
MVIIKKIGDKHGNIIMDNSTTSTTTNNSMTHDHEAFINQIRLFSGLTDQELKSIKGGLV